MGVHVLPTCCCRLLRSFRVVGSGWMEISKTACTNGAKRLITVLTAFVVLFTEFFGSPPQHRRRRAENLVAERTQHVNPDFGAARMRVNNVLVWGGNVTTWVTRRVG
jgi:hypothetical protein